MTLHINALPDEIVQQILGLTIETRMAKKSSVGVCAALATCRKWLAIILDLIWTDVVVDPTSLTLLLRSPSCNAANLSRLRSLTLHISMPVLPSGSFGFRHDHDQPRKANRCKQQLWEDLKEMIEHFQEMTNLLSFSLRIVVPEVGDIDYSFWLDYNILARLIRQLPPEVRYLELDTQGYDDKDKKSILFSPPHLCVALSSRLHKLEHVRLRLSRFCSAMLPRPPLGESRLKTLDINVATTLLSPFDMGPCGVVYTQPGEDRFQLISYRRLLEQLISDVAMISSQTSASRMQVLECFYDCWKGDGFSPKVMRHDVLAQ